MGRFNVRAVIARYPDRIRKYRLWCFLVRQNPAHYRINRHRRYSVYLETLSATGWSCIDALDDWRPA